MSQACFLLSAENAKLEHLNLKSIQKNYVTMFESITLQLPMGAEWIWIVIIIGVLIFGAKKIPELARTLGKSKGEFEKGKIESEKDLKEFKEKQDSK